MHGIAQLRHSHPLHGSGVGKRGAALARTSAGTRRQDMAQRRRSKARRGKGIASSRNTKAKGMCGVATARHSDARLRHGAGRLCEGKGQCSCGIAKISIAAQRHSSEWSRRAMAQLGNDNQGDATAKRWQAKPSNGTAQTAWAMERAAKHCDGKAGIVR